MAYDGTITLGTNLDNKEFDAQILQLERKINDMEKDLQVSISTGEFKEDSEQADELRSKIEKAKNQLVNLRKQKEKYNSTGYTTKGLDSLDISLGSALKKIGRIVLAVFSVRSAFSALSRASSTLVQYNDEYARNLEYIRYMVAQTLAPILEWVVQLVANLMGYINYLSKALFNVTLFSDKSAKNFASARKSTAQMKKDLQTTSFDEMNVLADTSTSGTSDSGGVPTLSFEDVEIPSWLEKLKNALEPIVNFFKEINEKYGPVVTAIVAVVGALLLFFAIKELVKLFTGVGKSVMGLSVDFTGFFDSLGKASGIIAILGGLALAIGQVTELIKAFGESDLTLGEVAGLLAIVLGELAIAFTAMAAAAKIMNWQSMAGAAVILGGLAIVINQVTKLIDAFGKSGMEVSEIIVLLSSVFITVTAAMAAMAAVAMLLTSNPLTLVGLLALVASISVILIVVAETFPTILTALDNFIVDTAPSIINILETITKCIQVIIFALGTTLVNIIKTVGNVFNTIFNGIRTIVETVGKVVQGIINSIGEAITKVIVANGNAAALVLRGIKDVIQQIGDTITQVAQTIIWFVNSLGPATDNLVSHIINSVTKVVNFIVSAIEYLVNTALRGLNNVIGVINNIPGINIPKIGTLNIPRFRPKLAVGAIINNPGRGVPVGGGSAIAGEAGREGILPLTDSQAMETLGEAIGKYVTINANIVNSMNGRVISRQIQQIQNERSFAYNG